MKVTDGVYAYPWTNMMENNCNTYVLKGAGLILVDPGLKRHVPDILSQMKRDGLNPEDIKLIMTTHSHPDHLDGVAHFIDSDIQMTMHRVEEKFLKTVGLEFFRMFGLEQPKYRVDFYANEGDLTVAGIKLKIILAPGHSPGSICIHWPEKETIITGDVVFCGSIGRTDFPGGSSPTLKKSIESISLIDAAYLLPGHNEIIEGKEEIKSNFEFIRRSFFSFL
ncbi:MAG: MBL fold metallo-hydrolase [Proteobacteria bacterium]|nr:MBL fold metallo-hydrolase [Pseudomonadota bacterium]